MALIVVSAIELQAVAMTTNLISATPNSRRPRFERAHWLHHSSSDIMPLLAKCTRCIGVGSSLIVHCCK